jgi:hypothetical protein
MKKILILLITFCLNACGLSGANENKVQNYGEKVSYTDRKEIIYPDFSLKFSGTRERGFPMPDSATKMIFYDFQVVKGDKMQTVSWSSGTGDIGPTFFYVEGVDYVLEMKQSDIKGSLGEGNIVIWKRSEFEAALKNKK